MQMHSLVQEQITVQFKEHIQLERYLCNLYTLCDAGDVLIFATVKNLLQTQQQTGVITQTCMELHVHS